MSPSLKSNCQLSVTPLSAHHQKRIREHARYNRFMPSGRVHNFINIASYSVLAVGVVMGSRANILSVSPAQALFFSLGFWAGTFLLSPDLDLAEGRVNSKRYWGALGFLWVPYGKMFSHRGMSHTWVVGPLTRLVYLAVLLVPVAWLVGWAWPLAADSLRLLTPLGAGSPLLVGYYLSQWLHLIADGVAPDHDVKHGLKKLQRKRRRKRTR